jgi:Na+/proline symporter
MPTAVGALAIAGVFAGAISTGQTLLLASASAGASSLKKLFPSSIGRLDAKKYLRLNQALVIVTFFGALFISTKATNIITLAVAMFAWMSPFSMIFYLALYWPQIFRKNTFIITFWVNAINTVAYYLIPPYTSLFPHVIYPSIICLAISIAAGILTSKERINMRTLYEDSWIETLTPDEKKFYRIDWKLPPGQTPAAANKA